MRHFYHNRKLNHLLFFDHTCSLLVVGGTADLLVMERLATFPITCKAAQIANCTLIDSLLDRDMEALSGQNYTWYISCCFVLIYTLFSLLLMGIIYLLISAIYFWLLVIYFWCLQFIFKLFKYFFDTCKFFCLTIFFWFHNALRVTYCKARGALG